MAFRPGDDSLRTFYKYRSLAADPSGTLNSNTIKLLQNGEMYFSPPSRFNDPFDCRVTVDTTSTLSQVEAYLNRQPVPAAVVAAALARIRSGSLSLSSFAPTDLSTVSDMLKVFCLAVERDNVLMWSHYAKDHTGICIGLQIHLHESSLCLAVEPDCVFPIHPTADTGLLPASPVEYSDKMPTSLQHLHW